MDAMRYPAPGLRIAFAIALLVRFGWSLIDRWTTEHWAERAPLFEFEGLGSTPKQSVISSVDWTVTAMLLSSIISVFFYPEEMAVVRLRCDTRHYFNWRDQYRGAMYVRAQRRDLDVADAALRLRARFPVWLEHKKQQFRMRMRSGLVAAKKIPLPSVPKQLNDLPSRFNSAVRGPSTWHQPGGQPGESSAAAAAAGKIPGHGMEVTSGNI